MENYFKAERPGIIYVCESSNCQDDTFFQEHKGPHVFFEIDADTDSALPCCPICGSQDNIHTHARAVLNTTEVLNEDEEPELITKSIVLTLHESVWKALENDIEASGGNVNIEKLLRAVVTESYWSKMELMGLELPFYKGSN